MQSLDRHDQAIIKALQEDGRLTVTSLADRVGLSNTPYASSAYKNMVI